MPEPASQLHSHFSAADRQLLAFGLGVAGHLKTKLEAAVLAARMIERDLTRLAKDKPSPDPALAEARRHVDALDTLANLADAAHNGLDMIQKITKPPEPVSGPVAYTIRAPRAG